MTGGRLSPPSRSKALTVARLGLLMAGQWRTGRMIRFEPRAAAPLTLVVAVPFGAARRGLALAAIPLAAAGAPIGRAFG